MKWDKEKIIIKALSLEKKLGRRVVKRDNSNLFFLAKEHFGSWNNLMKSMGHQVIEFREANVPSRYSKELFYFIGLLCSDGYIQVVREKCSYKIIIFTSYEEEKEMILKLMKFLFNYDASVRLKNYGFSKRVNYEVYIYSKKLCGFLIGLGVPSGNKSLTLKLPQFIMNSSKKHIWHFIRGIFDGDGSIINSRGQILFRIYSGSKNFIFDFEELVKKMDFSPKINKDRGLWSLSANKKNEVKKIFEQIYKDSGIYFYPRKRLKWKQQYI